MKGGLLGITLSDDIEQEEILQHHNHTDISQNMTRDKSALGTLGRVQYQTSGTLSIIRLQPTCLNGFIPNQAPSPFQV